MTVAPYTLGDQTFPTKAAATAAVRAILHGSPLNTPLEGEAFHLVAALLLDDRHPSAAAKIGPGIRAIVVRIDTQGFGSRQFWVQRNDGTETDFSYRVALNGAPSQRGQVSAALREEISEQVLAFRKTVTSSGAVCGICGRLFSFFDPTHVDHVQPLFSEMAEAFVNSLGGWDAVEIKCAGPTGRLLKNRDQAQTWQAYHRSTARLRLVHADCNLRRGAK